MKAEDLRESIKLSVLQQKNEATIKRFKKFPNRFFFFFFDTLNQIPKP